MCSLKAMKVNHKELKQFKNPEEIYSYYVSNYGDRRLLARLINGRKVKPCGRECREYGYLIASNYNHSSFENFVELMNDSEFILNIAQNSLNPAECSPYFYEFVNPYLKQSKKFRLQFLKSIYLNLNVYKLEDIQAFVTTYGFENENEAILNDIDFKQQVENKLKFITEKFQLEYHCSGDDKKELHQYKVDANELKILIENMKKGLTEILNNFKVGKQIEDEFTPSNYYEFLCQQGLNK